ncbi:helix-turn-helix transcriptional regulator [Microbulbifer magnicolonia]|uniref:response regulator transcription factor n=1 Tax=Microbulbifer magnicolonia TaxID=3109744 RepID=UPI002B406DF1|nr:helix-turn-helix transcriptional regulator [Microbulbifer sp. GG15]
MLDVGLWSMALAPQKRFSAADGCGQRPGGGGRLFSGRERQVIRLLSEGKTSAEIADRLSISVNTVKNHRRNILHKANCRNTGQLLSKCMALGEI